MTDKFSIPGRAAMVIDGQWGSSGKGLCAAYLARQNNFDIATTNASANAGHTTILEDGTKFVTFHLPTTAVIQRFCMAYLNAGAIIDPEVLEKELADVGFDPTRLIIHPHACVIKPEHKAAEMEANSGATKIGSTQKGVGAALAAKINRQGNIAANDPYLKKWVYDLNINQELFNTKRRVVIEVPQGFSLSLNSGMKYPFVTSREVTPAAALADAGVAVRSLGRVMMTARVFPIRVGHIRNEEGGLVGHSGPAYSDQRELTWEELGQTPERTTVTKRIRRVFEWSAEQHAAACQMIQPKYTFLNFCNYAAEWSQIARICDFAAAFSCPITHFGFGPGILDVVEGRKAAEEMFHARAGSARPGLRPPLVNSSPPQASISSRA